MKLCAYCDNPLGGTKTREHVIPNWYSEKDDISFNERSNNKISNDEIVIRDVCSECNNEKLSILDAYGKSLFEKYFQYPIFANQKVIFQYSYQKIVKWLLKISYNSARANRSDENILAQFRSSIISNQEVSNRVLVYVSAVAPSKIVNEEMAFPALKNDKDVILPDVFRVSVVSFRELSGIYWIFRAVTIHSFRFILAVPDLNLVNDIEDEIKKIHRVILDHDKTWNRLTQSGIVKMKKPSTDFATEFMPQVINNPIAHANYFGPNGKLSESQLEFWNYMHQTQDEIILIPIPREDVERKSFEHIRSVFVDLLSTRENVLKFLGRCEFSIQGYDDDSRELFEIKEVCEYLKVLNAELPYWLILQAPSIIWLKALYCCLGNAVKEHDGRVKINHAENASIINSWFSGLNEITNRFAIPLSRNKQQSALVQYLLEGKKS